MPMRGYYADRLSGDRLRSCYELASPRIRRYLAAETAFVRRHLTPDDMVLELGCGYGRAAVELAPAARRIVGIDNAPASIELARRMFGAVANCDFLVMDAMRLAFADAAFAKVVCIQNGISAFGEDRGGLLREALRVTRPGGKVLFSSYAAGIWPERLRWFEAQSAAGLLGPIDREQTGNGRIVCSDGFLTGTVTPEELQALGRAQGLTPTVTEVDGSSLFWIAAVPAATPPET